MRTFLFVTSALLLGAVLGSGIALWRFRSVPWDQESDESVESKPSAAAHGEPAPKVFVKPTQYDFGTLVSKTENRHDFVFVNKGEAPLTLADGSSDDESIALTFERSEVPAGASARVTATWTPSDSPGSVEKTLEVVTNDPTQSRIVLTLSGEVVDAARFAAPELTFKRLSMDETAAAETQLLCFAREPLKIVGREWTDTATAQYFDLAIEPLSENESKAQSARSGYVTKVTVKPGLPPGPFQQTLVLTTNVESSPTVSLPLHGSIASDITIVGGDWDADGGVLDLGHVAASEGLKRTVVLVVRGRWRHDVRFEVADVAPKFLKVGLGQPREINDGAVVEIPLTMEIPAGSPPAVYLGTSLSKLGEIILRTTHPRLPNFKIQLRLAIEG